MTRSYEQLIAMDLVELAKVTMNKGEGPYERAQCWEALASRMGELVSGWGSYNDMEKAMILAVFKCKDLQSYVAKHTFATTKVSVPKGFKSVDMLDYHLIGKWQ